jgi:hypothetical protein
MIQTRGGYSISRPHMGFHSSTICEMKKCDGRTIAMEVRALAPLFMMADGTRVGCLASRNSVVCGNAFLSPRQSLASTALTLCPL